MKRELWQSEAPAVLLKGLRAKFGQHPELARRLTETGTTALGEASTDPNVYSLLNPKNAQKNPSLLQGLPYCVICYDLCFFFVSSSENYTGKFL